MPLVFIHGSGGCKEGWYHQTQYFEGSEAIDLPGHPDTVRIVPCARIPTLIPVDATNE